MDPLAPIVTTESVITEKHVLHARATAENVHRPLPRHTVEMEPVTAEKIVAPALEIVVAALHRLPTAETAPAM